MFWELLITACTGVCAPVSPVAGNVSSLHESLHARALEPAISFVAVTPKTTVKNKAGKPAAKIRPYAKQSQKDFDQIYGQNASRALDMHIQGPQNLLPTTKMWATLKKAQVFSVFWRGPPTLQDIGLLQSFCRRYCAFGTEDLQAVAGVSPALLDRRRGFLPEAFAPFAKQKVSAVGKQFSTGPCPRKSKTSTLASSMPLFRVGVVVGMGITTVEGVVVGSLRSSIKGSISIKSSLFAVMQRLRGSRLLLAKQVHSLSPVRVTPQTV